jgi:hypothetical protein
MEFVLIIMAFVLTVLAVLLGFKAWELFTQAKSIQKKIHITISSFRENLLPEIHAITTAANEIHDASNRLSKLYKKQPEKKSGIPLSFNNGKLMKMFDSLTDLAEGLPLFKSVFEHFSSLPPSKTDEPEG